MTKYLKDSFTEAVAGPSVTKKQWNRTFDHHKGLECPNKCGAEFFFTERGWKCKKCGASARIKGLV